MRFPYTSRLGIAVGKQQIRALLVQSGVIRWHAAIEVCEPSRIADSLQDLLQRVPRLRRGTRVAVVVSPTWVQVKPLSGIPLVRTHRLMTQLLKENQQAFFLWKGTASLIAEPTVAQGGVVWGAAFDREVVEQMTYAFRAANLNVRRVTPAAVAIVATMPNQSLTWIDGDATIALEGDRAGIRRLDRVPLGAPARSPVLPPTLAILGADAACFLDAYAAALAPQELVLGWRLQSDEARVRAWARVRRTAMAAALCAAGAFAVLGPGLRARTYTRAAEGALARNRRARSELAYNESELRRVTEILNRVGSFSAGRGRVTRMLGDVAQSIPDSTAMLTFHVDSVEGGFTAIAPHVADVLPELANVRGIVAPRILGSVTHEVIGGVHVERASFRFRRAGQAATMKRGVMR